MSAGTGGQREVAYRLLAAEYEDADLSYSESDEERAPNYVLTPSGARVNRLFVVGVLTECERVSDDVLRARVVDPTGAFVLYAGQYQPDERAFLERADPPAFLAVTGKARTFQPEDSEVVYTSVRPESINEVDAETRDRWTVQAAEQTLDRVGRAARALSTGLHGEDLRAALEEQGVESAAAEGIALALDHYGTTPAYLDALRELALDSVRVVADQRSEVRGFDAEPDGAGDVTVSDLLAHLPDDTQDEDGPVPDAGDPATGETDDTVAEQSAEETVEPVSTTGVTTGSDADTGTDSTVEDHAETSESTESSGDTATESTAAGADQSTAGDEDDGPSENGPPSKNGSPSEDSPPSSVDESDPADFDPDSYDLDDEVREEVESEYGTEFQTGTEVDEPGAADIETPETPEEAAETDASVETEAADTETESAETAAPGTAATDSASADDSSGVTAVTEESGDATSASPAESEGDASDSTRQAEADDADESADGQEKLLAVMRELDDGSGADREAVVAAMVDRHGLSESQVGDLIDDALMDGQCYEPDDSTIQPI